MRRLLVLARPPAHGRAKTRLASGIGAGPATRFARAMLADTWRAVCARADGHTEVGLALCDPPELYPLLDPPPTAAPLPVEQQGPGDLGARMARLAARALADGRDVLLLGTDSPGLPPAHVDAALALLERHDVVLGPVPDGGFWCLGLSRRAADRARPGWLDGIDWSLDATRAAVGERARQLGLDLALAPASFDIDRADDLPALRARLAAAPRLAPATAALLEREPHLADGSSPANPAALVSIVIPCLDEAQRLDACLAELSRQAGPFEVLVSDGGSRDEGPERAANQGHVVLRGPAGRGRQLAAGAALASGDVLLFLHADVGLPPTALELVRAALADGRAEAGAFVTHTTPDPRLPNPLGPLLRLADLRSRFTRHPYGDQALFCTRAAYDAVGGFRPLPIMEDYDLAVRLAARRRLARIGTPVAVSGRRFQRRPLRTIALLRVIPPLYRLGVDPAWLARLYRSG